MQVSVKYRLLVREDISETTIKETNTDMSTVNSIPATFLDTPVLDVQVPVLQ